MTGSLKPVLILGAGINGAAVARELVLNGVPVVVVDRADISSGTTAYSSRLIHGGLRYLEFAEWDLVGGSLAERSRLLELAPQFVQPLRLFIPVQRRLGGWLASAGRFLTGRSFAPAKGRGLWLVRTGLWLYDRVARGARLAKSAAHRVGDPAAVAVDPQQFRWLCSYSDAQMLYPERFVLALLDDARSIARESGLHFEVRTYCQASLNGTTVELRRRGAPNDNTVESLTPSAIINATGAWVDRTLQQLEIPAPDLIGGTKGSHFVTFHKELRSVLGGKAIYTEAADGRPVFVLPFGEGILVGTTDLPFEGDPAEAVATEEELEYLLETVNRVLPQFGLTRRDVALHYCGVRPLKRAEAQSPAAISRRHDIHAHADAPLPLWSLVGGKLTTCRALAEAAAATVLEKLGWPRTADSRTRIVPGGEDYPADKGALQDEWTALAEAYELSDEQIAAAWPLFGMRLALIFEETASPSREILPDTALPERLVRWVIEHEWVETLDDLVERRLMLLHRETLTRPCLNRLAELLVEAGKLPATEVDRQVQATVNRLAEHFGRRVG